MPDARTHPTDFSFGSGRLTIRWADGARGAIQLRDLRKNCPCSSCKAERDQAHANPLHVLRTTANNVDLSTVIKAEMVGAYAIRVYWRDGHSTGMYDFELLRRLFDAFAERNNVG